MPGSDPRSLRPDNMKIIDANPSRTAFLPVDTVYTEGAVKVIIENVARAVKNGRYDEKKEPKDWL